MRNQRPFEGFLYRSSHHCVSLFAAVFVGVGWWRCIHNFSIFKSSIVHVSTDLQFSLCVTF